MGQDALERHRRPPMWRTPTNLGQAWGSVNGADDQPERFGSPPKRFGSPPERLVHTTVTMRKRPSVCDELESRPVMYGGPSRQGVYDPLSGLRVPGCEHPGLNSRRNSLSTARCAPATPRRAARSAPTRAAPRCRAARPRGSAPAVLGRWRATNGGGMALAQCR